MSANIIHESDVVVPPLINSICDLAAAYQVGKPTEDPDHPWKYGYAKEGTPPQAVIDEHLAGKAPVRLLTRPVGTQEPGSFIIVDIDNKERYKKDKGHKFLKSEQVHEQAEKIEQVLVEHGYCPLFAQSTCGLGIHFWLKFEPRQDLKRVKKNLLNLFQTKLGLKDGNAGIGMKQIEVLDTGGTLFAFNGHVIDAPKGGWHFSQPVDITSAQTPDDPSVSKGVQDSTQQAKQGAGKGSFLIPAAEVIKAPKKIPPPMEIIEKALEFVDPDDRDLWIRMALALKQEYGEAGFLTWDTWAQGSDKYKPAESKTTWAGLPKPNAVGVGSIFYEAVKGGFVRSHPYSDVGNSARFVDRYSDELKYIEPWCEWIEWSGGRWQFNKASPVMERAKVTVDAIYKEQSLETTPEGKTAVAKFALKSQGKKSIDNMLAIAGLDPRVCIQPEDLDSNVWFLGVKNGVLDLRTQTLLNPDPVRLITKCAGTEYVLNTQCTQWLGFLEQIMGGDQELIAYLQRAVGYSLTGNTSEQCLFLLHGVGANGKSVFLQVIKALHGDYADTVSPLSFMDSKTGAGAARSDIAKLKGTRFCASSEVEDGQRFNESLVKQMTGEEDITARFLYKNEFTFRPEFKIFMACNHLPMVRGDDYAIWRRLRLIPFGVTIPKDQRDKHLPQKLLGELPGILNWALEGLRQWQTLDGLHEPEIVRQATARYRRDEDRIFQWLRACCTKQEGVKTDAHKLWESFRRWCEATGENYKKLTQAKLTRRLTGMGYETCRPGGKTHVIGIALKLILYDTGPDIEDGSEYEDQL